MACGHHQPDWAYHLRDINNHWMHTALCDGIPSAASSSAAADDVAHYSVLNGNDQHFADKARPDDVVHIDAVSPQAEVCMLMTSVERQSGQAAFDLPDLSDELASEHETEPTNKRKKHTNALTHSHINAIHYHLYAIVEAANTALIPTFSAAEKKANKLHRNINRRVSNSMFIGTLIVPCKLYNNVSEQSKIQSHVQN